MIEVFYYSIAGKKTNATIDELIEQLIASEYIPDTDKKILNHTASVAQNGNYPSKDYYSTFYNTPAFTYRSLAEIVTYHSKVIDFYRRQTLQKQIISAINDSNTSSELSSKVSQIVNEESSSASDDKLDEYRPVLYSKDTNAELSKGIMSGISEIDQLTSGFQYGTIGSICAFTGHGKALSLDTKLWSPKGDVTMGTVKIGDQLWDKDGKLCSVVRVFDIHEPLMYNVKFENGQEVKACESHKWLVYNHTNPKKGYQVKETRELLNTVTDKWTSGKRFKWSVPLASALEFPHKELPINPYILGYYLGGGHSDKCAFEIADTDIEVYNILKKEYPLSKWSKSQKSKDPLGKSRTLLMSKTAFYNSWKELNLRNKHIPEEYFNSSIAQRWDLLRGLMDSDGSASKGQCEIVTVHEQLKVDIQRLLDTLGIKCTGRVKVSKCNGKECKEVVRFNFYTEVCPFKLIRKVSKWESFSNKGLINRNLKIVDIQPIGHFPARCIQTDSKSHTFLCGDRPIVTHNSTLCDSIAFKAAKEGKKVAVLSIEIAPELVWYMLQARYLYEVQGLSVTTTDLIQKKLTREMAEKVASYDENFLSEIASNIIVLDEAWLSKEVVFNYKVMNKKLRAVEKRLGGLDLVIWDHVGQLDLLFPDQGNSIIKQIQSSTKTYINEKGNKLVTLFAVQCNREGMRRATRRDGQYDLAAIADLNECERSSSYCIFLYTNEDMMVVQETKVQLIKHRLGSVMPEPVVTTFNPSIITVGSTVEKLTVSEDDFAAFGDIGFGDDDAF